MFDVTILNGDGYSEILTLSAQKVLKAAAEKFSFSLSFRTVSAENFLHKTNDEIISSDDFSAIKTADAVLCGAFSNKFARTSKNDNVISFICKNLCLYSNFKHIKSLYNTNRHSVLRDGTEVENVDFLIVHDAFSDEFDNKGYALGTAGREAYDTITLPEIYVERIARIAYELSESRNKNLASVDCAEIFNTEFLRRKITHEINEDYPLVNLRSFTQSEIALSLLYTPSSFDVIVTNKAIADSLFSAGIAIVGGAGNISEGYLGDSAVGLYKPAVVSSYDVENPNGVCPTGTILAAAKLLEYSLDKRDAARAVENAVIQTINDGFVTNDMKTSSTQKDKVLSTEEFTNEVVKRL